MEINDCLFIIPGSNTKQPGGNSEIYTEMSITTRIDSYISDTLKQTRKKIFDLINKGGIEQWGKPLRDFHVNQKLKQGLEFGGEELGDYLPAYKRFQGRLYQVFGDEKERTDLLLDKKHHILILTGLYGVVLPGEYIQDHQIDIIDDPQIARIWKEEHILTKVIISYCEKHDLSCVFDFTGDTNYRELINWNKLREKYIKTYHMYCDSQFGANQLIPFSFAIKKWLESGFESDLTQKSIKTVVGTVTISETTELPKTFNDFSTMELKYYLSILFIKEFQIIEARIKQIAIQNINKTVIDDEPVGLSKTIYFLYRSGEIQMELKDDLIQINKRRNRIVHDGIFIIPTEIPNLKARIARIKAKLNL